LPGYHVYVFERPDKRSKAFYSLRGPEETYLDADRIAVSVPLIDRIFEERLEYHLRIFRALHAIKEKSGSREQLEKSMLDYLRQVQQSISESNAGVASQLAQYKEEAASLEKTLHFGAAALDGQTIVRYATRLTNLTRTIELLTKKDDIAEKAQEALRNNAQLLTDATISYNDMKFPKKQEFARLTTTRIELSEIVPRWLQLSLTWSPFLGTTPKDIAYIWRNSAGEDWSDEEIELLCQMYDEDRDDILRALPKRTWRAVRRMAVRKGLMRHKQYLYTSLTEDMCYEDVRIMKEYGLEYSAEQREVRVWWKKETVQNNETSSRM